VWRSAEAIFFSLSFFPRAQAARELEKERRRLTEELGVLSDDAAAAIAALEGELAQVLRRVLRRF
jgi:hypothetical protein